MSSMGHPRPNAIDISELIGAFPPTPEQVRVIEAPMRPQLVVAGAGSGKTETMSMRVLWLVANQGLDPESILGLTFTRKAAGELGARLRERLERLGHSLDHCRDAGEPVSLTYNSFAERLVAEHGLRIGVDPDFRMLGQAQSVQLMTDIVTSWTRDLGIGLTPSGAVTKALSLAGHLAEHDLSVDYARGMLDELDEELSSFSGTGDPGGTLKEVIDANRVRLALLDVVAEFSRRKREEGYVDFADQLMLATRIVREHEDVVRQVRSDYQAVLLDEFQDTSVIQMELLSRLFADHPVTAVGDPNQAIYGWRGASAASLETFLDRFQSTPADDSQTMTLSTSWRNDTQVLATANVIAEPLREHATRAVSPVLRARQGAGRGLVLANYRINREEQAHAVADFIQTQRVPRGSSMTTAAVLCRRRADFAIIDRALRERDIPTQVIGLGGLLAQPAVADVRAALELAVDVTNSPWAMRLLAGLDLGAADLAALWSWATELAHTSTNVERPATLLLDAIDSPPPLGWTPGRGKPALTAAGQARVRVLGERLRAVRQGRGRSVVDQVERAISIMGVVQDSLADPLLNSGREALDRFVDVANDFDSGVGGASIRGFLDWLAVAEDEEHGLGGLAVEPDPLAVQIMTIHGAKGLEWDAVAVFAMDDGVFPKHASPKSKPHDAPPASSRGWLTAAGELPHHLRGDGSSLPPYVPDTSGGKTLQAAFNKWIKNEYSVAMGEHAEREERRLAYVAVTRARSALLMAGSWIDNASSVRYPSRYVMEPLKSGVMDSDPSQAIAPQEAAEQAIESAGPAQPVMFPPAPERSRQLVSDSAERVAKSISHLLASDEGNREVLASLAGHPMADDVTALLDERTLRAEQRDQVITSGRIPATSVSRFVDDPAQYAIDLRRPLPQEPRESSAFGTIVHAWIERQLHLSSGELWDEPVPGEEILNTFERSKLERIKANFPTLEILADDPIAIEEPFSVEVAGVFVQGRIDAVFSRDGVDTVVDWKSGRIPSELTDPADLRYFITQLGLYRTAWAQRTGKDPHAIRAVVIFPAGPQVLSLEDLSEMVGGPQESVEVRLAAALEHED